MDTFVVDCKTVPFQYHDVMGEITLSSALALTTYV